MYNCELSHQSKTQDMDWFKTFTFYIVIPNENPKRRGTVRMAKLLDYKSYSIQGAWHWFNTQENLKHHQNVICQPN